MNSKKRTPTGAATSAGAKMEAETGQATTSKSDNITVRPQRQAVHIADFLSYGSENGVTLVHLEKLTCLTGRKIRRQIERERRSGSLIISDNKSGYFLTDDPAEAQRFARSMLHRSREIAKTARAIEEAAGLD